MRKWNGKGPLLVVLIVLIAATDARAESVPASSPPASAPSAAPESTSGVAAVEEEPIPASPPRRRGLVIESGLGALGFLGDFRHVAPPAFWLHTQVGYEPVSWGMLFVEGELAFTDTSVTSPDPSQTRAFPIWGFGIGARATARWSDRWANYVQFGIDGLKADVPRNALAIIGYRDAETFTPSFGGRVGVEWYQSDPHFAFGLSIGGRFAPSFAKVSNASAPPVLGDAALALRYTF